MRLDRKRALILLGIATVGFTVILELIDPSQVSHGPTILDFEFAGSRSRAAGGTSPPSGQSSRSSPSPLRRSTRAKTLLCYLGSLQWGRRLFMRQPPRKVAPGFCLQALTST